MKSTPLKLTWVEKNSHFFVEQDNPISSCLLSLERVVFNQEEGKSFWLTRILNGKYHSIEVTLVEASEDDHSFVAKYEAEIYFHDFLLQKLDLFAA
jgi:hypothetical protein